MKNWITWRVKLINKFQSRPCCHTYTLNLLYSAGSGTGVEPASHLIGLTHYAYVSFLAVLSKIIHCVCAHFYKTFWLCLCMCIPQGHVYREIVLHKIFFSYMIALPEVKICQHLSCGSSVHHWQLLFGHVISIECYWPWLDVHNIAGFLQSSK